MLYKRRILAAFFVTVLLLLSQGCNMPVQTLSQQPEKTKPAVSLPPTATTTIKPLETLASSVPITLEFTEAQLNELANQALSSYQQIQKLHISLVNGAIQISGKTRQSGISLPFRIVLKANVDSQGRLHTEILSGKAGPFPLPQSILDEISTQIDRIIQNELYSTVNGLFVDSVVIEKGKLTIIAHVK